jgi:hypothetical protein
MVHADFIRVLVVIWLIAALLWLVGGVAIVRAFDRGVPGDRATAVA